MSHLAQPWASLGLPRNGQNLPKKGKNGRNGGTQGREAWPSLAPAWPKFGQCWRMGGCGRMGEVEVMLPPAELLDAQHLEISAVQSTRVDNNVHPPLTSDFHCQIPSFICFCPSADPGRSQNMHHDHYRDTCPMREAAC